MSARDWILPNCTIAMSIEENVGILGRVTYCPAHRTLTRLGFAYAVDSATRPYYLLPDGIGV